MLGRGFVGSLVALDLFGGSGSDDATTTFGKRIAAGIMLAMGLVAIAAREVTLWGVIELKMELLIQCVPAFLLAIHWRGLRARSTLLGLLSGTGFVLICVAAGVSQLGGVHVGMVGLGANALICALGSRIQGSLLYRSAA